MANNSASAIRTALETQLDAVSELVGGAHLGRTMEFGGFPACRFYLAEVRDEPADTAQQYRSYIYSVDIVMSVSINGVTKSTSEGEFEDAVDAVMDRLNTNWLLGTTIEHSLIEGGTVREEEGPHGLIVFLPLTVTVRTLISL